MLIRYLDKHPELMNEEVSLAKFSFQIPKPLQEDYVRKRPTRPALQTDAGGLGNQQYLPQPEGDQNFAQALFARTFIFLISSQKVVVFI